MVSQFRRNVFPTYFNYADYPVDAGEIVAGLVILKQAKEPSLRLLEWMEAER